LSATTLAAASETTLASAAILSATTFAAAAFCAATHAALQTGSGAGSGADGAAGGADVVIEFEAADGKEVAAPFVAVTVNVYGVDAFKPETVIGEELPDAVTPPGDDVTV
jgi:hypothetical protein